MRRGRRLAAPIVLLLSLGSIGLDGCTPVQSAAPPAPPPHLGPIEAPEDVIGELLVRDPQALLETVAHAAATKALDPAALLANPEVASFGNLIDLHGSVAVAVLGDPRHLDSLHVTGAVRVKDPKAARVQFAEAVTKGRLKVSESPAIRSKIYLSGKTNLALIGETLVFADNVSTLESAGRWIGKETEGTPSHELSLRVPLSRWSGQLKGEARSFVDAQLQKDADVATLEPVMRKVVDLIGDLGDVQLSIDLEKEDAVVDFRLGATGGFSSWLGTFPASSPRSLLTLPRGSGAFVVRLPDAVSDTVKALFVNDVSKGTANKELEHVRVLARAIGREAAFVYAHKAKPGGEPQVSEAMARIEIVDPVGAKGALKSLIADWVGKPGRKVARSPWSRLGADGESLQFESGSDKFDVRWAIKGNSLLVDVAWDGKVTLIDAAVDPNSKSLLANDVRARSFADKLPKEGLAFAYYAQTSHAPKLEQLGAVPALEGIRWGWASASKAGVASAWNVPLADLAAYFKSPEPPPEP